MRGVLGLGLQSAQVPAAHGRAQALPTHSVPVLAQRDLQPAGAITAPMAPKGLDQGRFPNRCLLVHRPLLSRLPRIIPTGRHPEHLVEPPHRVVAALGVDEAVATHWSGVCESLRVMQALAMAFYNMSSACRRARVGSWRSPASVAGSRADPNIAVTGVWAAFFHW